MLGLHIGNYTYFTSQNRDGYKMYPALPSKYADVGVKSDYDRTLHQSLEEIFRERFLNSSDKIKEFLRGPRHDTEHEPIIKPILKQEPILRRQVSKRVFKKLSLQWIAVLGGYTDSAELLVRSGADVNELFGRHKLQMIDEKWTILHVLIQMEPSTENERLIRLVTDHGADLQARDYSGQTVLHYAIEKSRVEITEMLLEKGADVNAADNRGMTPLLQAADNIRAKELLPLLVKHGANVLAKNRYGENVLHRLTVEDAEVVRVLIDKRVSLDDRRYNDYYQPIHMAIISGMNELIKLYLDHGANVNALGKGGTFPLYLAALLPNNLAGLETMLKRGANIDQRTHDGRTALHAACKQGIWTHVTEKSLEDVIRLLLSAGADLLAEGSDGMTPFACISSERISMESSSTRLMIRALAMKKVCQPSIELKDELIIEKDSEMSNYYRECIDVIKRMKSTSFIETCTFFELLAKCHCQIAARMRNPEFEISFEKYDLTEFSMYAEDLHLAFKRAQNHYYPMQEQEDVISEVFYHMLPYVVLRKIVHRLCDCCENVK